MKLLLRLAVTADAVVLATLMLGSWTRINGAGLTCPDWPLCHGSLFPSMNDGTLWEWSHRLLASTVAPLIVALIVVSWRERRRSAFIAPTLIVIAALFLVQIFLGAQTVRLANTPYSVVLHWATAMALIAALSAMAVFAAAWGERSQRAQRASRTSYAIALALGATALGAFVTMCIGAYVSSSGAGLACLSIPGCAGRVVVYTPGQYVQMLHRFAAAGTLILAAGAAALAWALPASARVRATVLVGTALVATQVMLGLLNVALRLPPNLREAHAVNAALVFLTFFVATAFAATEAGPLRASVLRDYYELSKPRIIVLLLVTTAASMVMAARGVPPLSLTFWTLLGGALAAASAGAFNCVWDADIDRLMKRTQARPIPAGRISRRSATVFAIVAGVISFGIFYALVNPLAAWLSLAGNLYYVGIYTIWLKRITPLNIVVGGAAGSVPPLVGWAAVTHSVGAPALGLFALIFLWTPPHFWSLALMTETDYGKAKVPMFPNVYGADRTKREIVYYSILLVGASLLLYPLHVMGAFYFAAAAVLGGVFVLDAVRALREQAGTFAARKLFRYSLLYLALMCAVMVIDRIVS